MAPLEQNDFIFLVTISTLAYIIRSSVLPRLFYQSFAHLCAREFVSSVELVTHCFEYARIAENYGLVAYSVVYVISSTIWYFLWEDEAGSPIEYFQRVIEGRLTAWRFLLLVCVELLAGYCGWVTFSNWVYAHEPTRHLEECETDLNVPVLYGILIEGAGTFLESVIPKITEERNFPLQAFINSLFSVFLVLSAWNFTGGWYSPTLAFSVTFGCKGATTLQHITVYWGGSLLGGLLATFALYNKKIYRTLTGHELLPEILLKDKPE